MKLTPTRRDLLNMSSDAAPHHLVDDDAEFTFADRAKGATIQSVLKRPFTMAATLLVAAVVVFVGYLEKGRIAIELPVPEVSKYRTPSVPTPRTGSRRDRSSAGPPQKAETVKRRKGDAHDRRSHD